MGARRIALWGMGASYPNFSKTCALQTTTGQYRSTDCDRGIAGESTNQLDRKRGWEAESRMRVASLESVLAVATLVLAIVIVLWGIKIFHGV